MTQDTLVRADVRLAVDGLDLAARVVADLAALSPTARTPVACCFPGGGMSARYFTIDGHDMAAHLAAAGMVVVAVDHPAIGASDTPADAWTLVPEIVADADAAAAVQAIDALRRGSLVEGLPPLARPVPLGVGHSMGAMLAVYQQAQRRPYAGLVLLGHSGRGLPEVLTPDELAVADDAEAIRASIVELSKTRFGDPLPIGTTDASEFLVGPDAPTDAVTAIGAARSHLLACCGLTSMIPGSHNAELAAIDVPVFLGLGEHDIAGPTHDAPKWLTASPDVTLYVQGGAHHNHNIAPTRAQLWDRVVLWAATVL